MKPRDKVDALFDNGGEHSSASASRTAGVDIVKARKIIIALLNANRIHRVRDDYPPRYQRTDNPGAARSRRRATASDIERLPSVEHAKQFVPSSAWDLGQKPFVAMGPWSIQP